MTGGAGFIGSHIADLLVRRGHDVVMLDSLLPQAHSSVPEWTKDLVHGDVRDLELVTGLLAGVDVVCHQAAVVGHGLDPSDAPAYVGNNDLGTAVLLAAMHSAGVRPAGSGFVDGGLRRRTVLVRHAWRRPSGAALPGDLATVDTSRCVRFVAIRWSRALIGEDAPLDPRSTYAATKTAQEHLASAWARQTGGERVGLAVPQRVRAADASRHALCRGGFAVPFFAAAR